MAAASETLLGASGVGLRDFFFDDHRHAVGGMTYSIGQPMNRPFDGKK
jgi:hypothetical protein